MLQRMTNALTAVYHLPLPKLAGILLVLAAASFGAGLLAPPLPWLTLGALTLALPLVVLALLLWAKSVFSGNSSFAPILLCLGLAFTANLSISCMILGLSVVGEALTHAEPSGKILFMYLCALSAVAPLITSRLHLYLTRRKA